MNTAINYKINFEEYNIKYLKIFILRNPIIGFLKIEQIEVFLRIGQSKDNNKNKLNVIKNGIKNNQKFNRKKLDNK